MLYAQGYVVVTKDEGLVFKRVCNRVKEEGKLLLISTNPSFEPYEIAITDVLEVWKYALKFIDQIIEEIPLTKC